MPRCHILTERQRNVLLAEKMVTGLSVVTRLNKIWCADLTYAPMAHGFLYVVAIMDWHSGKCWLGGSPTPRTWPSASRHSMKYECVYLNAFRDFKDAQRELAVWMNYYNEARPHSALGDLTPSEAYTGRRPMPSAA